MKYYYKKIKLISLLLFSFFSHDAFAMEIETTQTPIGLKTTYCVLSNTSATHKLGAAHYLQYATPTCTLSADELSIIQELVQTHKEACEKSNIAVHPAFSLLNLIYFEKPFNDDFINSFLSKVFSDRQNIFIRDVNHSLLEYYIDLYDILKTILKTMTFHAQLQTQNTHDVLITSKDVSDFLNTDFFNYCCNPLLKNPQLESLLNRFENILTIFLHANLASPNMVVQHKQNALKIFKTHFSARKTPREKAAYIFFDNILPTKTTNYMNEEISCYISFDRAFTELCEAMFSLSDPFIAQNKAYLIYEIKKDIRSHILPTWFANYTGQVNKESLKTISADSELGFTLRFMEDLKDILNYIPLKQHTQKNSNTPECIDKIGVVRRPDKENHLNLIMHATMLWDTFFTNLYDITEEKKEIHTIKLMAERKLANEKEEELLQSLQPVHKKSSTTGKKKKKQSHKNIQQSYEESVPVANTPSDTSSPAVIGTPTSTSEMSGVTTLEDEIDLSDFTLVERKKGTCQPTVTKGKKEKNKSEKKNPSGLNLATQEKNVTTQPTKIEKTTQGHVVASKVLHTPKGVQIQKAETTDATTLEEMPVLGAQTIKTQTFSLKKGRKKKGVKISPLKEQPQVDTLLEMAVGKTDITQIEAPIIEQTSEAKSETEVVNSTSVVLHLQSEPLPETEVKKIPAVENTVISSIDHKPTLEDATTLNAATVTSGIVEVKTPQTVPTRIAKLQGQPYTTQNTVIPQVPVVENFVYVPVPVYMPQPPAQMYPYEQMYAYQQVPQYQTYVDVNNFCQMSTTGMHAWHPIEAEQFQDPNGILVKQNYSCALCYQQSYTLQMLNSWY